MCHTWVYNRRLTRARQSTFYSDKQASRSQANHSISGLEGPEDRLSSLTQIERLWSVNICWPSPQHHEAAVMAFLLVSGVALADVRMMLTVYHQVAKGTSTCSCRLKAGLWHGSAVCFSRPQRSVQSMCVARDFHTSQRYQPIDLHYLSVTTSVSSPLDDSELSPLFSQSSS